MGETLSVQRQGSDSTQSHVHMHDSEDCTGQQGHSWVGSTVLHWQAESFLAGKEHSVWSVFPCLLCPEGYFLLREAKGHRGHLFASRRGRTDSQRPPLFEFKATSSPVAVRGILAAGVTR